MKMKNVDPVFLLTITVCIFHLSTARCSGGWFGLGCRYFCRCKLRMCRPDGSCLVRHEPKCVEGWFGPYCQYADLVPFGKLLLEGTPEPILIDNKYDSCIPNKSSTFLEMKWDNSYSFTWMRLAFASPENLSDVSVKFWDASARSMLCANQRNVFLNPKTVDVHCDVKQRVKGVLILWKESKRFCEVEISGGRNIAYKRKTSMTFSAEDPSNAVDGVYRNNTVLHGINPDLEYQYCTTSPVLNVSQSPRPEWNLTFTHEYLVTRYLFYFRPRAYMKRFSLTSYDCKGTPVVQFQDHARKNNATYEITTAPKRVTNVTVKAGHEYNYNYLQTAYLLTMCELEVYGEVICEPGRYGFDCERDCQCNPSTEQCITSSGACVPTYPEFPEPECHLECQAGLWGHFCAQKCKDECRHTCDPKTGECPSEDTMEILYLAVGVPLATLSLIGSICLIIKCNKKEGESMNKARSSEDTGARKSKAETELQAEILLNEARKMAEAQANLTAGETAL